MGVVSRRWVCVESVSVASVGFVRRYICFLILHIHILLE